FDVTYKATDWFTIKGAYSMDKNFYEYTNFFPKGYATPTPSTVNNGAKQVDASDRSTQIMSATAIFTKTFGDFNVNGVLKYQSENYYFNWTRMYADNFAAEGVEDFIGGQDNRFLDSYISEEQAEDYFVNVKVDYADKYIFDGLVRRDGSSLFGENERWQTYYRASLAYRITQDFEIPYVQEMKVRASYGVSGQRPDFTGQYETFSVDNTGISPVTLGNKDLKPSEIGELEVGLDVNFFTSYTFVANYSYTVAKDQFLRVPLAGYMGYTSQFQNAGEVTATALEFSIGGTPVTGDFTWNFNVGWDKITQEISALDMPPFTRDHVNYPPYAAINLFRVEEGLPYGTMYGNLVLESVDDLTVDENNYVLNGGYTEVTVADFTTNSDGYVILKGTENTIDEKPILLTDDKGEVKVTKIGDTNPDFNLGLVNTFNYKGITLYTLIEWSQGGDIYNYTKQLLYFNDRHLDADEYTELGKKKTYFDGSSVLYNKSSPISHFVEDGTYVKVREISLSYDFDTQMLGKVGEYVDNLKLSLIGRNLFTFTQYTGFDPEVAISDNPTNFKLDEYSYPNYRTYAVTLQVSF
ncbi:MAG: TonB-dependent receptor, partial [Bacteroidales bacterium]|nr:TonB-dependent receptor [Bacteroidales bacterium]